MRLLSHLPLVTALFALLLLAVPLLVRVAVSPHYYGVIAEAPEAEVAIILGASVEHKSPSPVLAARADTGIALYSSGKVQKLLVSGDNGTTRYDEVTPTRKYLVAAGIPPRDIFLDHAGFDTYSSMYRLAHVFGARSAIVVTQDFHMPRALLLARAFGIDAVGVAAFGGTAADYLREIPATWKAIFDLALARTPKFLGDPIPLSGDGERTWF